MIGPTHILLQGFDEGFTPPPVWAIVLVLVILAAACIFALRLFLKWFRNLPKRVDPAPRGFPVKTKEEPLD